MRTFSLSLFGCLLAVAAIQAADDVKPIAGLGPVGEIKKVEGTYQFTEGPAPDKKGNLYFSDVAGNKTYVRNAEGKVSVFRDPSNNGNGLMVNAKGEVVTCEMQGQIVAVHPETKKVRVVADKYNGARFNAPNDLVLDKDGGVYFTDPAFRAPTPLPQGKTAVYYAGTDGKVTRLLDDLPNPNGVILSPDEKSLYVIPSGQAEMMVYPVEGPGKLGKGKVFCKLQQAEGKTGGGGDGLTLDVKGNLYITSALGLQVFDPSGKQLGIIKFPEQPANAAFGGKDMKTLFVTARTSVYFVQMEVAGHRFPGGKE